MDKSMKTKLISKIILHKLAKFTFVLGGVTVLTYIILSYSPIDPIRAYIGADMLVVSEEQKEAIADYWGINDSKWQQFINWFSAIIQGDFGTSLLYRQDVLTIIKERFTASIWLMGTAWVLSGIVGFTFGLLAGMKEGSWIDWIIKNYCYLIASTPAFWVGILLVMCFSVWLPIFPVGLAAPIGMESENVTILDRIYHLVLPVLTLTIVGVANIALHTREKLIELLKSPYIRFARAQGLSGFRLIGNHAIRNISLPAISLHFASFGHLFGGAILAEQVFSYPGLGTTIVQAGLQSDVPLLLGIVIFSTIFVFLGNVLADILYVIVDPRMRESEAG